jgi:hypothetical protein
MASRTVAAHVDETTSARLKAVAGVENRAPSQIMAIALKTILEVSPGARRALFAIDGIADEDERGFAMKAIGRAALKAYERVVDARQRPGHHPVTNDALNTDEGIEAEAVRLCRP